MLAQHTDLSIQLKVQSSWSTAEACKVKLWHSKFTLSDLVELSLTSWFWEMYWNGHWTQAKIQCQFYFSFFSHQFLFVIKLYSPSELLNSELLGPMGQHTQTVSQRCKQPTVLPYYIPLYLLNWEQTRHFANNSSLNRKGLNAHKYGK